MRRRKSAERFRPVLKSSAIAVAASIEDMADGSDFRFLLVRHPDGWTFKRADDHRLHGKIETVTIQRRHPDGVPSGRYLRVPIDSIVDPWGRVAVDLEFETYEGIQHAELSIQTRDDAAASGFSAEVDAESMHMYGGAVLAETAAASIFFVEGNRGDVLDLTDDKTGRWQAGDSDGAHTLYRRHDPSGKHTATIAVRKGITVNVG